MKKTYITPETKIVLLNSEEYLLAGSGDPDTTTPGVGDDTEYSNKRSIFDWNEE